MRFPPQTKVQVGLVHRTFRPLELLVYDYDQLGVRTRVLPTGRTFQPWEPLPQWRGMRVPVTLGESATAFDWGVSVDEGLFLHWDDYFEACGTDEPAGSTSPRSERLVDPFADLPEITARLLNRATSRPGVAGELKTGIARLARLRDAYSVAAEWSLAHPVTTTPNPWPVTRRNRSGCWTKPRTSSCDVG